MELREGFKQTEVGIIPQDWEIKPLCDITSLMTNGFVGTATSHYSDNDSDILYIQGYNVEENSFNFTGIKYVTIAFHKQHIKSCLQENDLLTIQTGDVGLTTIVPKELEGSNCHALIITRFNKDLFTPKYFSYYFNSKTGRSRLKEIETGTTMKHINVGDLKSFLVPLPPTKAEQTAIATAFSDMDNLIAGLEQLIAKKKAIKQGAMQELLRPKGGWVVKKVQEIGVVGRGRVISHREIAQSIQSLYPVFSSQTTNKGIMGYIDSYDFEGEYITWTTDGENARTVFYRNGKFNCTNVCGTIKLKHDNPRFVAYMLAILAPNYVSRNLANPKLMNEPMKKIEVPLPERKIQDEIAEIILDLEVEVDLLEGNLEKYIMLKQGMMQELLTGKTRLI